MDFSDALKELRAGKAIARKNWNGKNMFIYLVPQNSYPAQTDVAKKVFGESVPYVPYIAIKTVDNQVAPWVASQTDLLNDDWTVVDEPTQAAQTA